MAWPEHDVSFRNNLISTTKKCQNSENKNSRKIEESESFSCINLHGSGNNAKGREEDVKDVIHVMLK